MPTCIPKRDSNTYLLFLIHQGPKQGNGFDELGDIAHLPGPPREPEDSEQNCQRERARAQRRAHLLFEKAREEVVMLFFFGLDILEDLFCGHVAFLCR